MKTVTKLLAVSLVSSLSGCAVFGPPSEYYGQAASEIYGEDGYSGSYAVSPQHVGTPALIGPNFGYSNGGEHSWREWDN